MSEAPARTSTEIPNLPLGWRWATLGELGVYVNGRAFKPDDWGPTGLPIIRIENLNSADAPFNRYDGPVDGRHRVGNGDLLISWSASLDAFIWDRGPAALNQHIFRVVVNDSLVTRDYLFFAVKHVMTDIRKRVQGATMQHVTKPVFEATLVPLPPREAQERIAAALHEQLGAAARMHAAIETQRPALASIWKRIADDHFLGRPAERIACAPLHDLCQGPGQYGTSTRSNHEGRGLPVLGMPNIGVDRIKWEPIACVDLPPSELARYRLRDGDLLFNRTNSAEWVGKTAVYRDSRKAVFASYVVRFRLDQTRVLPEYVSALINSTRGRRFIEAHMTRAIGQVNISASTIGQLLVPLVPVDEQRSLVDALAHASRAADRAGTALQEQLALVSQLEQALLRRAFSPADLTDS